MGLFSTINITSNSAIPLQFSGAHMNDDDNAIGCDVRNVCNTQEPWREQGRQLYQLAFDATDDSHRASPSLRKALCDIFLEVISTVRLPNLSRVATLSDQNVVVPYDRQNEIGSTSWHDFLPRDPIRFPAAAAVPIPAGGNQVEPRELAATNRLVEIFLKEKKYLSEANSHISIDDLLKAAVNLLEKDLATKISRRDLARCIQNSLNLYGGSEGEFMPASVQNVIIRNWMVQNVFGASIEHTIIKIAADHTPLFSLTGKHILDSLSKVYAASTDPTVGDWIWTHVILEEVPILRFKSHDVEHLKPHDFEWGQIHAGLHLAASAQQDMKNIALEDALVLGQSLLAQIKKGIGVDDYSRFFKLPSLIRYVQTRPDVMQNRNGSDIGDLAASALADYLTAHNSFLEQNHPASRFQRLFNHYKTRSQLAQEMINDRCPEMKVATYLNLRFGDGSYCSKDTQRPFLPNINTIYQEQINDIASAHEVLDHLLMTVAWDELPKEERQFIHAAEIKQVSAQFSARDKVHGIAGASQPEMRKSLTLVVGGVEFFSARNALGKEQIYALKNDPARGGYHVIRVDRNRSDYEHFLTADQMQRVDADFKLLINPLEGTLKIERQELETLIEKIAMKHQQAFKQQLYDYGYSRTDLEHASDFLLSLIPFYSCIHDAKAGHAAQAALTCGIDVMLLIPLLGQLSSSSIKIGQAVAKGGLIAARNVAAEMAAGNTLKTTIAQSGRAFSEHVLAPAAQAISKKEITAAGIAALRVADPGIALSWTIGRAGVGSFVRHCSPMLGNLPRLNKILPHLKKSISTLPQSLAPDAYTFGRIPGLNKEISVIKTGLVTATGVDIYVWVDIKTGMRAGHKYVRSDDGVLSPVAITPLQRVENILDQGLGGKGAPKTAATWAKNNNELAASSSAGTARQAHIDAISQTRAANQVMSKQEIMNARMSIANEVSEYVRKTYYKAPNFKSSNKLRTQIDESLENARLTKANEELARLYKQYDTMPEQKLENIKLSKAHNCGELSYLAANFLSVQQMRAVQIVDVHSFIQGGAHAFAAILPDHFPTTQLGFKMGRNMDKWSSDILIVDPWANIVCPAPEYNKLFKIKMDEWYAKGKEIFISDNEGKTYLIPANNPGWLVAIKSGDKKISFIPPDLRAHAERTHRFKGNLAQQKSKHLPDTG